MSRPITTQDFRNRLQTASMNQRPNYNSPTQRAPIQQVIQVRPLKDTMGNDLVVYNKYILNNVPNRAALNGRSGQYRGDNKFVFGPGSQIVIPEQGNITIKPDPDGGGGGRKKRRLSRKMKRTNRRKMRRTRRR